MKSLIYTISASLLSSCIAKPPHALPETKVLQDNAFLNAKKDSLVNISLRRQLSKMSLKEQTQTLLHWLSIESRILELDGENLLRFYWILDKPNGISEVATHALEVVENGESDHQLSDREKSWLRLAAKKSLPPLEW